MFFLYLYIMDSREDISILFKIINRKFCLNQFPVKVQSINFTIYQYEHYNNPNDQVTRFIRNSLPVNNKIRLFVEFQLIEEITTPSRFLTPLFYEILTDLIKTLGFFELLKSIDLNIELK